MLVREGQTVRRETIPILHDHHNHPSLYAALDCCQDLSAMDREAAEAFLRGTDENALTVVRGWRTNELSLDDETLRALPPLLIINFSLHGYALSDKALPFLDGAAGILAEHRSDPDWGEANLPTLFAAYCSLLEPSRDSLAARLEMLRTLGIGSVEDLTIPTEGALDIIRDAEFSGRVACWAAPSLFRALDPGRRAACAGVKLYLDGAFGARSAAIAGPWIGEGAARFVYDDFGLARALEEISDWGVAVAIHAIGELAIEQALAALEGARRRGDESLRIRLEHAQMISRKQAFRARDLGLTLSMQPNFSSDSRDYADRLPPSYLAANNPFRMLIDEAGFVPGRDLVFGSDGMPDGIAYAATEALFPAYPVQRLALEELVAGYGPALGTEGRTVLEIDEPARRVRLAEIARDGLH